jgi:hypothetical protein
MGLITWFFSDLKRVLFFAVLILIAALLWSFDARIKLKKDNDRVSENFAQVTKENQVLNLSVEEYKQLDTENRYKLDSLLKVIKLKPKYIKGATIINTEYKDTGTTKIVYKTIEKLPSGRFSIPFESSTDCWGVKAAIISADPTSTVNIKERTTNNSIQLLVIKRKKFLFWTVRKEEFKAFSDCGEVTFTQINFVKR